MAGIMNEGVCGLLRRRSGEFFRMTKRDYRSVSGDVRHEHSDIQSGQTCARFRRALKEHNLEFDYEADMATSGPCSASLKDPDGNVILLDQHY